MTWNDKQLFELLLKGDEASFRMVYNHFYPRLYYFALEYIPQKDLAEDIVHDTFLTLWRKKEELKPDTNLNAYLYTLTKNNSLKKLRDERYRKTLLASMHIKAAELDLNTGSLENLDTSELAFGEIERIVLSTLAVLTPQCRQVFELSRFENRKNREIAEELGISVKTVEGHMTRAIRVLRTNLRNYLPLVSFLLIH